MPSHPPTLLHALRATAERIPDTVAVRDLAGETSWTWRELRSAAIELARGLHELGVRAGDRVGLLLSNRPEFHLVDLAVASVGAIPFSIYTTYAPEQIEFVLKDSGATAIVVEQALLGKAMAAWHNVPDVRDMIVVDGEAPTEVHALADVARAGQDSDFDVDGLVRTLDADTLLTLIYTSGTTGDPKAVELTHGNIAAAALACDGRIPWPDGSRVISWLPAAHIAERIAHHYLPIIFGAEVTCCPDPKLISQYLPQVRPTWFFAVPRVWEKMKAGLEAMLYALPGEQGAHAKTAVREAVRKVRLEQSGEPVPPDLATAVAAADGALFAGIRAKLGLDAAHTLNVGAAPTPPDVLEFFHAIGLPVSELWGLSESTSAGCSNPPDRIKIGTVGIAARGVQIRLADDGEILLRGGVVTRGYRNRPELTAETIVDGWLHTGDIGSIDEDGYLSVVDRKKELIINAMGKNMSPAMIESRLKAASPLIGQACCIGDGRPYNTALIVLDADAAPAWAKNHGIVPGDLVTLAGDERIVAAVEAGVEAANTRLARVEQIKKFTIVPGDWLPAGVELTPTMKLRRGPIAAKYAEVIEAMYA